MVLYTTVQAAHRPTIMTDYLRSPVFQLKCVELLLGLVAIAFIIASATPSTSVFLTQVVHFTLFGYSLLDLLVIGGFFLREPVSKFLVRIGFYYNNLITLLHGSPPNNGSD
ncbi:hypothetical protein J6590_071553 [Homalodisca vitripennis]|nr:hypothetical protein J6590_071553 [Homalodisca vitripennis]